MAASYNSGLRLHPITVGYVCLPQALMQQRWVSLSCAVTPTVYLTHPCWVGQVWIRGKWRHASTETWRQVDHRCYANTNWLSVVIKITFLRAYYWFDECRWRLCVLLLSGFSPLMLLLTVVGVVTLCLWLFEYESVTLGCCSIALSRQNFSLVL